MIKIRSQVLDQLMYESVKKNQVTSVLNNIFYPYIAAYRELYNTQHVFIRLLDEWRETLYIWI